MKADAFTRQSSFYHPVASAIVSCLEKRVNFINRGLFEVKSLQSENFVAEKFAITTESRLFEGFVRDFAYLQRDVSICVPEIGVNSGSIKMIESQMPAKYRLVFCPLDSVNNFARGVGECGSIFLLQSILPSGSKNKYENVFSLFYSFKAQKFLYAEHKGLVYLENKRMKALHRRTSLTANINTNALLNNLTTSQKIFDARIKNIFSRGDGVVSDCFDIANGSIDGIIYSNIKVWQAMALQILLSSLTCYSSLSNIILEDDLTKEVDLIAGAEIIVKAFPKS
jgi:fructose-1,6-bisphosphatase/inositol monophosphatase family enzyme